MKYVNTGFSSKNSLNGTPAGAAMNANYQPTASATNCEFCASAGAANLAHGHNLFSSGDVSSLHGVADRGDRKNANIALQVTRVRDFVTRATGRCCAVFGSAAKEEPFADARKFMRSMMDGTVFVVYVSGDLKTITRTTSHWLNAARKGNDITFYDFQTNRDYGHTIFGSKPSFIGALAPSSCSGPFVGVVTQCEGASVDADMRSNDPNRQTGMLDEAKTKAIVLAFPPVWTPASRAGPRPGGFAMSRDIHGVNQRGVGRIDND